MNARYSFLIIIFWTFGLLILGRLFYWQVVKADELQEQASRQQSTWLEIPSPRGEILAQDGYPLVTNEDRYLLYVNPRQLASKSTVTDQIANWLSASDSARLELSRSLQTDLLWYVIAHQVSFSEKTALQKLDIPGLGFEPEPGRVYPEGSSSAHITGFVGKNESGSFLGYFGLEGYYDRELSGHPGRFYQEHDAFNRPILIGSQFRQSPRPGHSLMTSIDRTVQFTISQALSEGISRYQAEGGTITVMDPKTGLISGMVAHPGYDPSTYNDFTQDLYKNPVISDSYEPGSIFKVLVMASALDAKVVKADTICSICTGPVIIGDAAIRSWNDKYYPNSTARDIILHSDNVGMVFVSRLLGKSRTLDYIRRFGIGSKTGIDLQEEDVTPMRPNDKWYEIDWATTSFGQGIAVTPMQMVRAVGAIANGGKLVTPRVVTKIQGDDINKIIPLDPPANIISPESAALITQMMVNGVNNGEVRYYKPKGYLIAGKTGTAQIPISGHYDPDKVIASFIGFAPADNPKFVMLVTLNNPKPSPWGSTTAAPLWMSVAKKLFAYYKIPSSIHN